MSEGNFEEGGLVKLEEEEEEKKEHTAIEECGGHPKINYGQVRHS